MHRRALSGLASSRTGSKVTAASRQINAKWSSAALWPTAAHYMHSLDAPVSGKVPAFATRQPPVSVVALVLAAISSYPRTHSDVDNAVDNTRETLASFVPVRGIGVVAGVDRGAPALQGTTWGRGSQNGPRVPLFSRRSHWECPPCGTMLAFQSTSVRGQELNVSRKCKMKNVK